MEETLINEAQAAIEQEGDIEKVKSVLSKITKAYSKNTKRLDKIIHLSDRQQDTLQKLNEQAKNEQEMAHRKQKAMIANDFEDDENFDIKIVYLAADILSGDAYSLHKTRCGGAFVYLIDAMGHGLLPSLTSFALASFVKQAILQVDNLGQMLSRLSYLFETMLSDGEQLSGAFFWFSPDFKEVSYAMAGMYPAAILDGESVLQFRSNNPPAMNFMPNWNPQTIELGDFKKLLLYSDGLVEGGVYSSECDEISKLFDKDTIASVEEKAKNATLDDDLTVTHFAKI